MRSLLLVGREARRTSRRWQHTATRAGVATFALAALLLAWDNMALAPGWDTGVLGRNLFEAVVVAQLFVVVFLAPVLVAGGLEEERDRGTLELLTLTHLRPRHVVLGQVGSRLLSVLVLLAGGVPAMALALTMGGVAPLELVQAVAGLVLVTVTLGAVGAWLGVGTRGGMAPLLGALALVVLVWGVYPLWVDAAPHANSLVPLAALTARPAHALAAAALCLPLVAGAVGGTVLRLDGVVDPERRTPIHRRVLGCGGWTAAVGWLVVLPLVHRVLGVLPDPTLRQAGWWLTSAAGSLAASFVVLQLAAVIGRVRSRRRKGWRALLSRRVWSAPVVWRELRTRAHGPMVRVQAGFAAVALLVLAASALWALSEREAGLLVVGATLTSLGLITWGLVATAIIASRSGGGERTGGTLELLALTTLSAPRLVAEKLVAPTLHGLVPLLVGVVLGQLALLGLVRGLHPGPGALVAMWLMVTAGALLVGGAAWGAVVAGSLVLGLRTASPRAGRVAALGTAIVASLLLGSLYVVQGARWALEELESSTNQWIGGLGWVAGEMLVLAVLLAGLAGGLLAWTTLRLRRWAAR